MSTELTITEDLQQAITGMAQTRNALMKLAKDVLVKDQDFGVIPGVSKPSLLKPGAEKLVSFFQLSIHVQCMEREIDLKNKFVYYTYKCSVKNREDRVLAECEGSTNSYETKYRYSWSAAEKPADAEMEKKMIADKTAKFIKGANGWQWVKRVDNPDVIGLQNTIQKMAQKRAIVGAVLLATGASEFFTQDVEDMDFIDVEKTIVDDSQEDRTKKPTDTNGQEQKALEIPAQVRSEIAKTNNIERLNRIWNRCPQLHSLQEFKDLMGNRKKAIKSSQQTKQPANAN